MRIYSFFKFGLFILCLIISAQSECIAAESKEDSVNKANRLYISGDFDKALEKYNQAGVVVPDSDIINFNIGAALYKKEDYQKAQDAFTKALVSKDSKIESDALYNIGNCRYKLGKLKENTDLSATVGLLRESLDYYKRAVEIDQDNMDARFNHEFTERELKILLDKLKQQEKENKGTCDTGRKQSGEDKDENQSGQRQDQGLGEKEAADSAKGQEGQDEEKKSGALSQQQEGQEEDQKDKEGQGAAERGDDKELSEEGARMILERYGQEDASPNYNSDKTRSGYDSQVLKDW